MSDNVGTLSHKIDSLVFDCFQKSSDIILQGRRCTLEPEIISCPQSKDIASFKDNSDYCCQVLRDWRINLNSPLVIDVSVFDQQSGDFQLMERWKIIYKRKDDTKDGRLSSVSRRIITLMRTLYCFVRLLPGFQLLHMCPSIPTLIFRLYNPEQPSSRNFVGDTSYYDFPRIQTFRGTLYLGVRYMAVKDLERILQIPRGLLSTPSERLPSNSHQGRGSFGNTRSTVPIPIPGIRLGAGGGPMPSHHSMSEKTQPRHHVSSMSGIANYPASFDQMNADGNGARIDERNKDSYSMKRGQQPEHADHSTQHSRSLDSRPHELHSPVNTRWQNQGSQLPGRDQGPYGQMDGLSPSNHPMRFEDPGPSLATPPKHPQRPQQASSSSRYSSGQNQNMNQNHQVLIGAVGSQDTANRHSQGSAAGSLVSDPGTSPGGGNPFFINGTAVYHGAGGGGGVGQRDSIGREGRPRSGSAFTGMTTSEAEGDAAIASGVSGISPPYLECSTQLMSTSPQVGVSVINAGGNRLLESQRGAMTLYSMASRKGVAGERTPLGDVDHHQTLITVNVKNAQQPAFVSDGIALSLHVALPKSPFDTSVSFSDPYSTSSGIVCLPRSQTTHQPSQVSGKSGYGHPTDHVNVSEDMALFQDKAGGRYKGTGLGNRRTSFPYAEDDDHDHDRSEEEEDDEHRGVEEDDEDMPFAWADQSTVLTHAYDSDVRAGSDPSAGSREGVSPGRGSYASNSSKSKGAYFNMPPALVSFPDAPWCESGTAAVAAAIINQLNEYREFRSTYPA